MGTREIFDNLTDAIIYRFDHGGIGRHFQIPGILIGHLFPVGNH
jgi:hypothetical protein